MGYVSSLLVQHGLRAPGLLASLSSSVHNTSAGSHDYPGVSCDSIRATNPKLQNGWFWIDPNEGCKNDSVQVFCNFTTQETCLSPSNATVCTFSVCVHACTYVCVCVARELGSSLPLLFSPPTITRPNSRVGAVRTLVPISDQRLCLVLTSTTQGSTGKPFTSLHTGM